MSTNLDIVEAQVMSLTSRDRSLLLQRLRLSVDLTATETSPPLQGDSKRVVDTGRSWAEDHAEYIAAYNLLIETEGLALDEWRNF
jgi:post-segregation antitoxin (ccd killing protein)